MKEIDRTIPWRLAAVMGAAILLLIIILAA
jgi:hypothetical protein